MGLAASQARFLGLTARKSNVEYQAQQINQQRTALANEIAGLQSKYNKLNSPVPPSINDFSEMSYRLEATYEDYEITSFSKILSGTDKGYYSVELKYGREDAVPYPFVAQEPVIKATKNAAGEYTNLSFQIGSSSYYYEEGDDDSTIIKITDKYAQYPGLEMLMEKGELTGTEFYAFVRGDKYYYTSKDSLDNTHFDEGVYNKPYTFYYQGTKTTEVRRTAVAAIDQGTNGRLTSIQFISCPDDPGLEGNSYEVTNKKIQDNDGYQDAMNEYEYEQVVYEKQCKELALKTEDLQRQDKTLELQLNQIDTEQNAISTEMDSVSKVIEDTIEKVFKTFN